MGSKKSTHPRGSQWMVVRRCLAMLCRLMRGNTPSPELLDIVYSAARDEGEELTLSAAQKRFEEDRARLKLWFECDWEYDRKAEEYELLTVGLPLLDLSDPAAQGLAFLDATFSANDAPMRDEVQTLVRHIKMLLPPVRRREIDRYRTLTMDIKQRDKDEIDDEIHDMVQQACSECRQLEFDYSSPQRTDGPVWHLVEPMRYFFDPVRSHYYLEAFNLESHSQTYGRQSARKVWTYRLGRIKNARILPNHFATRERHVPTYPLEYTLTPEVARFGVTEHIPNSLIFSQEDGSALIQAKSKNLFFDVRTLLHYGANCRIIGGEEALRQVKPIVEQMYNLYQT
jgi:predicted DNA-binding transcriptional regulator YafY